MKEVIPLWIVHFLRDHFTKIRLGQFEKQFITGFAVHLTEMSFFRHFRIRESKPCNTFFLESLSAKVCEAKSLNMVYLFFLYWIQNIKCDFFAISLLESWRNIPSLYLLVPSQQ